MLDKMPTPEEISELKEINEFLEEHGVEEAIGLAVGQVIKQRPPDPVTAIGRILGRVNGTSVPQLVSVAAADADDGKWTATAWLLSPEVVMCVAEALLQGLVDDGTPELDAMRRLAGESQPALIERLTRGALLARLAKVISSKLESLPAASAPADSTQLHNKFAQDESTFTLKYGDLSTFYGGLESKIGSPEPRIFEAMEREHTGEKDSDETYTTSNYALRTTPKLEWWFVATPEREDIVWPREGLEIAAPGQGRAPLLLKDDTPGADSLDWRLDKGPNSINSRLKERGEPVMLLEEAIGGRLYTGPMFAKYNDTLRGFGPALAGCQGNTYTTTIHVINSCIVKSSKLTKVATVYRGIVGGVLPDAFWTPNSHGVRGGVEAAFLSTTFRRDVALAYARAPGRPGIVFEMQLGMVARIVEREGLAARAVPLGCCSSDQGVLVFNTGRPGCRARMGLAVRAPLCASNRRLIRLPHPRAAPASAQPHERECCFPPLTGLEVQRTRVDNHVLVIEARVSANLNSLTIEQVVAKRQHILLDMARGMRFEVANELLRTPRWAERTHCRCSCAQTGRRCRWCATSHGGTSPRGSTTTRTTLATPLRARWSSASSWGALGRHQSHQWLR